MKIRRLSFSLLFPVAALAIWTVLVPIQTGIAYYRLHRTIQKSGPIHGHSGQFELVIREASPSLVLRAVTDLESHTVTNMNLPGLPLDVLISRPISTQLKWLAGTVSLDGWKSLSLPFLCLPAWWLVGEGVDGLLKQRKLHTLKLLVGSILFLLFVVILFGYFTSPVRDRADLSWLLPGFVLWTLAFAVLPTAWVLQLVRRNVQQ